MLQSNLAKLTGVGAAPMRGGTRGKVAPKYRNPDNPSETWAGRGLGGKDFRVEPHAYGVVRAAAIPSTSLASAGVCLGNTPGALMSEPLEAALRGR
jgi:hypothetical protein